MHDESPNLAAYYDVHYYENYAGGQSYRRDSPVWQTFFTAFAEKLISELGPRTVLDVGCSVGILVEALRDRGVEAWGVDISEYAIAHVREDIRPFCRVSSITDDFERAYDLIVCIEVIEHIPRELASRAVANIADHTNQVLFSSTPDDFGDPSHFNVQPSDYWVGLFAKHSIYRDVEFDASFVSPHAILLRRENDPPVNSIRAYERKCHRLERQFDQVRAVNMSMFSEIAELRTQLEQRGSSALVAASLRALGTDTRRFRLARRVVRAVRRMRRVVRRR